MKLPLISALAAALVGCSSASQETPLTFEFGGHGLYQGHHEQSSKVYSKRRILHGGTITAKKTKAAQHKNNTSTKTAESHVAPKMDASSFIRPDDKSNIIATTPTVPTKTEILQSSQLHDEAKKTEIPPPSLNDEAKKTEIPQPSQFNNEAKTTEISPSSQLNDESVITKAKASIAAKMGDQNSVEFEKVERAASKDALGNSIDTICGYVSDNNSGPKLFLYIVQKDEAYIGGYAIATTQYRNVCSITTLGR